MAIDTLRRPKVTRWGEKKGRKTHKKRAASRNISATAASRHNAFATIGKANRIAASASTAMSTLIGHLANTDGSSKPVENH